jgi:hypothetical protein
MATPMSQPVIVASVLGADYARLREEQEDLTAAGLIEFQPEERRSG